jgi:hypothetical protein
VTKGAVGIGDMEKMTLQQYLGLRKTIEELS